MNQSEIEIRDLLERIIESEAIDPWLNTYNDSFGCKPIDMIGTERQKEIETMVEELESGMPG